MQNAASEYAPRHPEATVCSGWVANGCDDVDPTRQESSHVFPHFLPDGRHFVYLALSSKRRTMELNVGQISGGCLVGYFAYPPVAERPVRETVAHRNCSLYSAQLTNHSSLTPQCLAVGWQTGLQIDSICVGPNISARRRRLPSWSASLGEIRPRKTGRFTTSMNSSIHQRRPEN